MKYLCSLFSMLFFTFVFGVNNLYAGNVITAVDKETGEDKVLLKGTITGLKKRILFLDDVQPLCRGERSFLIRHFDSNVQLVKGKDVWFWMIGSCDGKNDVIDIIAKPRGLKND